MVAKVWGREEVMYNGAYAFKKLIFHHGGCGSKHFHRIKDETWWVASGVFTLVMTDPKTGLESVRTLEQGDTARIPPCTPHQVRCISVEGGMIIEASTHHNDNDTYRITPSSSGVAA